MKENKINILHFTPMLKSGGIETLLYEYYLNIDKTKYKFSFATQELGGNIYDKLLKDNIDVYYLPPKNKSLKKYFKELNTIFHHNKFDIVHVHQGHMSFIPLYYAKKAKIERRIVHIHWTGYNESILKKSLNLFYSKLVKILATDYVACSKNAAIYLYGQSYITKGNVTFIKNAINLDKFTISSILRDSYLKSLSINGQYIISMIGRFTPEKNHKFAVKIFEKVNLLNSKINFLFVGDGPLKTEIEQLVHEKGFAEKCIFLGNRNDVPSLLNIVDILIQPSFYEGLGISIIEAQALGVKCVVSDNVPLEVNLTSLVSFVNLEKSPDFWCSELLKLLPYKKKSKKKDLEIANYSIKNEVFKLEQFYDNFINI